MYIHCTTHSVENLLLLRQWMILLTWALTSYKVNSYPKSVISFLFCFDMEKESNDQVIIFTLRMVEWTLPSRVGFRRKYSSQE